VLDAEIRQETVRRDAVKLLRDTVEECRQATVAAVSDPVAAAATRTFHRIGGPRLGRIRLSGGLRPSEVEPALADGGVEESRLSGGEREQLHLAVRLALGLVLAKEERQLVVLDDILTATDGGRLARVLSVLSEAAERLQIVILTCHPERYGGLKDAGRSDLEALVRGE
jgi:exonuclease SbcC